MKTDMWNIFFKVDQIKMFYIIKYQYKCSSLFIKKYNDNNVRKNVKTDGYYSVVDRDILQWLPVLIIVNVNVRQSRMYWSIYVNILYL